jgi:hypothetical protein
VYVVHRPSGILQLRLTSLLQLPWQPAQDMIECKLALAPGHKTPAAHPSDAHKTLQLHGSSPNPAVTPTLHE